MLASLIVVFREVLEAGLIVGIVLAATQGVPQRGRWIASGIAAGVLGAMLLASCAGALSDALEGNGQEVFNACVLMVAVVMLAWHVLWMARHGREMALQMRAVGEAVVGGQNSLLALAIGLYTITVRHLFSVTGVLITLLAAGMAGQAAAILAGADLIPTWGMDIWNSSALLPENSLAGRTLHVLIGYSERPMGVQVAAYVTVLALLLLGSRLVARQDRRTRAVRAAAR
jgi:high-affinity iron transporter